MFQGIPSNFIDTHIHLASSALPNGWVDDCLNTDTKGMHPQRAITVTRNGTQLTEQALQGEVDDLKIPSADPSYIFVECGNSPGLSEAKWALAMAANPSSRVTAVVANIPVPEGGAAVRSFLNQLKGDSTLPSALKGARVVMNPPDVIASEAFAEGLQVLQEEGLHWEWCCHSSHMAAITAVVKRFPNLTFVLDHAGRNGGTANDFEEWKSALTPLAACSNVVVKLGAVEEWGVADPAPLLDLVVTLFGFDRLLFESNWFVSKACGFPYSRVVNSTRAAVLRNGGSEADLLKVFRSNAIRVYRL